MKETGNIKSNKFYNPDEMRNRPPTNMEESERDSELEKFIRRKYEFRRFIDAKPPPVPSKDATFLRIPSSSSGALLNGRRHVSGQESKNSISVTRDTSSLSPGNSISRSRTAPLPSSFAEAQQRARSPQPPLPTQASSTAAAASNSTLSPASVIPPRSSSAAPGAQPNSQSSRQIPPTSKPATSSSSVFDDLISLAEPLNGVGQQAQPPLQMNPWASLQAQQQSVLSAPAIQEPQGNFWSGQQSAVNLGTAAFTRSPQHANTLPSLSVTSPSGPMYGGLGTAGGLSPQYQQQRSASLGSMAFSPGASPISNPFFASSPVHSHSPMQAGLMQQQTGMFGQPFGTSPSPSPTPAMGMGMGMGGMQQPQQQQGNGFGAFASSMMPSQQTGMFQQPQQQQQQQQQPSQSYGYAMQAGQQAFGQGAGYWG